MATHPTPRKLWDHPNPNATAMARFKRRLEATKDVTLPDFYSLYQWSTTHRAAFWDFCWKYFPIIHDGTYTHVVDESARIDSNPDWFPGIRLNFAENVLFSRGDSDAAALTTVGKEDGKIAVTEVREGAIEPPVDLTWKELRQRTGRLVQALKAAGLQRGDRVAAVAGNGIDTLVVFLATTALGGIFTSTSTDTGITGILDRLRQTKPVWVFMDDVTVYNGKTVDLTPKFVNVVEGLSQFQEFKGVVALPRFRDRPADVTHLPRTQTLAKFLATATSDRLEFVRLGFRDPFLIVYSSGTTGEPKCIVHSVGGVVLNMYKEGRLHRDMDSEAVLLQYTTTGWIMYLSCISVLLIGAKSILYDGSPFLPDIAILVRLLEKHGVTHFGTSPRWMQEIRKSQISPRQIADLHRLKAVVSTGMVLSESLYEWFYDEAFPPRTQLANISGGTDLAACFALDNPLSSLYVGGCQGPSLGIPIAAFEQADESVTQVKGIETKDGEPGELVATAAFPSMPVRFWGDEGGKKYFGSYFARFDNVWTHGDFISKHPTTHQIFFLGRSDGVLNPSGVRFGSAEIYNVIDTQFSSEVVDSVCVGQRRPTDTDESVMLFLLIRDGATFSPDLVQRVRTAIRKALSARHVPRFVFETPAIPVTVNGKKVELPVKQIVSGKRIKPSGTLLNPESLEFYYQFAEVENLGGVEAKL
ncbi:acetoacetyl-CoA synthase [Aspergillus heteromorphus CBS 117.55]|uniref:Acetoacetyl-CoA synthase n=1 Tax=Aspergillus heteromorphus CBS 117.55 TaxID=1448321 RepID=A0A317WPF9_9EURO|nr:acetoacetyl-CoA synthase [Aspergillus heteromorphus CBS 117.55]PWY88319.1 acetoacetyl-CoA synthase [Aspergillus heteromorphus CBS 117.55]